MSAVARPFLMFQGEAEAALEFYVSVLPGGRLLSLDRWGAGGPGEAGKVRQARFAVGGLEVMAMDSPQVHAFGFTPSISLFIDCADEAELKRTYAALVDGGQTLMPLGEYGFSRRFGWVNDRFGVSWQLNLA